MTKTFYPFDNSPIPSEAGWANVLRPGHSNGVLYGELNQFANSAASGLTLPIQSGRAWIDGGWYESDATDNKTVATGVASGNPRIDRVCIRKDYGANTTDTVVVAGTAAGSPSPPTLTNTSSVIYVKLYQVRVNAGSSSITSVTDERTFTGPVYDSTNDRMAAQTELASGQAAVGMTGTAVVIGDFGDTTAGYVKALSSASNAALALQSKGTGTGTSSAILFQDGSGNTSAYFTIPGGISSQDTTLVIGRQISSTYDLQRVTQGASDSGGSGFRVLRVPN